MVGDSVDPDQLLGNGWQQHCLLLYPDDKAITPAQARAADYHQLLILDGTWRKTARLLHLNPWLAQLPRLALPAHSGSRYRIRKSPRADGLSTIEAAAEALNALHDNREYDAILAPFDLMIRRQISAMGATTFRRNYRDNSSS